MAVRIGELLLKEKKITPTQLQEALGYQKANGGKLATKWAENLVAAHGVQLTNLRHPGCIALMRKFVHERPDLWNEDIGVD